MPVIKVHHQKQWLERGDATGFIGEQFGLVLGVIIN